MIKYMKYEIKGSYKFILGIIAIVLIASTIIQFNVSREIKDAMLGTTNMGMVFPRLMFVVSILVIFGAFLTAFFQIIGSFKKELYEDRGYLTFTLPLTGNQILGSKLIVALLWYLILGLSIVVYNLLLAMILFGGEWMEIFKEVFSMLNSGIFSLGLISGISVIMTLILIYFSIALSKVSVRNKKIGGLWFIIFIILNSLISYLVFKISSAFPYFLDLSTFKVVHQYEISHLANLGTNTPGQLILFGMNYNTFINIIGNLSQIVIGVLAFITTGHIIEKKIDL